MLNLVGNPFKELFNIFLGDMSFEVGAQVQKNLKVFQIWMYEEYSVADFQRRRELVSV
jgi:hypothetical protein